MYSQNNQSNTAVMECAQFILPTAIGINAPSDDLSEDMEGLRLTFPKVKIPGGGVLQFEMESDNPERPDYVPELEGILLFNHPANAYWPEGEEYEDNTPPLCQSVDGKIGYGNPGGLCASCGFNTFGSASNGRGKACKNQRTLYLLRSGEFVPIQISLPPTSLTPYNAFYNAAFARRQRPLYSSVVRIGLKRMSSNGYDYSVATFCKVRELSGEELAAVKAYADTFRQQVKNTLTEQAVSKEMETGAIEVGSGSMDLPDNEAHFSVGMGIVDGECEQLPA